MPLDNFENPNPVPNPDFNEKEQYEEDEELDINPEPLEQIIDDEEELEEGDELPFKKPETTIDDDGYPIDPDDDDLDS